MLKFGSIEFMWKKEIDRERPSSFFFIELTVLKFLFLLEEKSDFQFIKLFQMSTFKTDFEKR